MINLKPHTPKWSQLEDSAVWSAFRNDNREAFAHIYSENVKALYSYGRSIVSDPQVVEDLIQELFIELWNTRKNLSHTNKIHFYLLKSLRYKIYRSMKDSARSVRLTKEYRAAEDVKVTFPHEDQLVHEQITEERRKALFQALQQLSPRQREVLNLLFFKKYSYEQVSDILSLNLRSVYTLAWKALSSIRKNMEIY